MLNFEGPDGGLEMIAARVYIELIAENLGLAIANLQLQDRLANLAVKDPLTGRLNRRSLDENLNRLRREATDLPRCADDDRHRPFQAMTRAISL
ncbi:hypothetical protein [Rhizobium leguminosarum]|uniref:hypothetical protein n=1 Tax=Rhizobium leguminosarum TaxID=384 RepID=UPI001FDFAEDA|nr:hypothetical protein [Rhizobium leguminosarum]